MHYTDGERQAINRMVRIDEQLYMFLHTDVDY